MIGLLSGDSDEKSRCATAHLPVFPGSRDRCRVAQSQHCEAPRQCDRNHNAQNGHRGYCKYRVKVATTETLSIRGNVYASHTRSLLSRRYAACVVVPILARGNGSKSAWHLGLVACFFLGMCRGKLKRTEASHVEPFSGREVKL